MALASCLGVNILRLRALYIDVSQHPKRLSGFNTGVSQGLGRKLLSFERPELQENAPGGGVLLDFGVIDTLWQ